MTDHQHENEETIISEEELNQAVQLFNQAYPYFIEEIDRVEAERGKLNDFQLMIAVSHAKQKLEIISWNCRKTVNAIFQTFVEIYRRTSKEEAEDWAEETFGTSRIRFVPESDAGQIAPEGVNPRIHELKLQIQAKEAELLLLYQELVQLQEQEQASQREE
ncbi:hypothetical protein [Paenibacillus protaetiae]|uniref:Uncharacterized protein n=1 Tax=Paenibacillus protaetiae TaxID=2509456 RepID=A0A4P6ETI1_9BACL|nr:hypothetical protein [Paenibacillus protaetiae]QAY65745.1 hypothetical protein ET464_04490 [Paenibacillus protaetiae]